MLRNIYISSFKCFDTLDIQLGSLTLLSGLNGGGKSSIIQALVLLAQTLAEREWGCSLLLEGPDLALGSVADVLNQRSARKHLTLGLATEAERVEWTFKAEDRRALTIELESVKINDQIVDLKNGVRWLLPLNRADMSEVVRVLRRLDWITAERIGPREILPLQDREGHSHVGRFGELAAGLLYQHEADNVNPALCLAKTPPTLFHQVKAQMQLFFPGCDLRISPIEGASAVTLRLRSDPRSDFQRPQNVGFGLIQLFPVIVALLSARAGDVLLIENPEIHLHPRAQQDIGSLIAQTVASGVQVIVETHSDHVLNGIRLAVKTGVISSNAVAIHFFAPPKSDERFVPLSPQIDSDGRLDAWPEGFFDQIDIALSKLL